jgi:hypothetical protein
VGHDAAREVDRFYPFFQHAQIHSNLNGSGPERDINSYPSTSTSHTPAHIFFASERPVEYFTCATEFKETIGNIDEDSHANQ